MIPLVVLGMPACFSLFFFEREVSINSVGPDQTLTLVCIVCFMGR